MRYVAFLIIVFCFNESISQSVLKESLSLDSKILGRSVEYSIYLPDGYESSDRSYPVLYLLHGYTDDETGWTQFGEVKKIADREMQNEEVTQMIIAMPDAGLDWYVNTYDGKNMYEDFFTKEFIPYIEKTFRGRSKKEFRAVAGLSMGGHGTFLYSMKYPDLFAAAAPLSAAAWTEEEIIAMPEKDWNQYFGYIFGENKGKKRITDHVRKSLAYYLIQDTPADELKKVRYYIDCGDDDFLIKGNLNVHSMLIDKEVPHEFRVRDGAHNWEYWRTALPEVLKFVSVSFHR